MPQQWTWRPYQLEAIDAIRELLTPKQPCVVMLPTGGGKTSVANAVVAERLQLGEPVLWVAPRSFLLGQACNDLAERHPALAAGAHRVGLADPTLSHLPDGIGAGVTYATLQTWSSRIQRDSVDTYRPSLLVVDESHWGEHGSMFDAVMGWALDNDVAVLGLTATPRPPEDSLYELAFSRSFHDLVSLQYLARPIPSRAVATGVVWNPSIVAGGGDFDARSLAELGDNETRNALIVDFYHESHAHYGKTILFAVNQAHAEQLATLFYARHGIAARAIHSAQPVRTQVEALDDFRKGRIDVITSVDMLSMGIDVPSARSVFLCRPTTSDVRFSQMIGRGARRDPATGKDAFHIVEFEDLLSRFGDQLVTPRTFFHGAARPTHHSTASTRTAHRYDDTQRAIWLPESPPTPEALHGLWVHEGQTFGIEIELTRTGWRHGPDWRVRAEALRHGLVEALGRDHVARTPYSFRANGLKDPGVWNIDCDLSAGWEVSSRILQGAEGFAEAEAALEALTRVAEQHGLSINHNTGLHIHLGWDQAPLSVVKRAVSLMKVFEPALGSLVAPSRIARFDGHSYQLTAPNRYANPISTVLSQEDLELIETFEDLWSVWDDSGPGRYVTLNLSPLRSLGTVEFRLHSGTTEARKVLLWTSLCMQILWAAAHNHAAVPDVEDTDVITPDGDIIDLARLYLPRDTRGTMHKRLDARRREILARWASHPDLRPWLPAANSWLGPHELPQTSSTFDRACEEGWRILRDIRNSATPAVPPTHASQRLAR